jgi:tetratricopeptide (TPR) repeat protein
MATLQTDEANIIDAEAFNWRLIVYPVLVVLIVGVGALGYYYYQQSQRDTAEAQARAALIQAKTPQDFLKVAADFPDTDQALLATLRAADASYDKQDYQGALDAYGKVLAMAGLGDEWHDTALLGTASAYEAMNNTDKAISAYLTVARRGLQSPFASYAYVCAARIYDQRGDKDNERQMLQAAAGLDPNSTFTRMAVEQFKQLQPTVPNPNPAPSANPAPTNPTAPAPAAK